MVNWNYDSPELQRELADSYRNLEDSLPDSKIRGFNDQACKIRKGSRGPLKKSSKENAEQIINEETKAIEISDSYQLGEDIADHSVDSRFWPKNDEIQ